MLMVLSLLGENLDSEYLLSSSGVKGRLLDEAEEVDTDMSCQAQPRQGRGVRIDEAETEGGREDQEEFTVTS